MTVVRNSIRAHSPSLPLSDLHTGIPHFQELARTYRRKLQTKGILHFGEMEAIFNTILKPGRGLELPTRIALKEYAWKFVDHSKLDEKMREFCRALFEVMFPIFGERLRYVEL